MFLNHNLHCLILEMTSRVTEPQACIRQLETQKRLIKIRSTSSNHLVEQERQDDRWKALLLCKAITSNSSVSRTKHLQHWKEQILWAFNLAKITKPYQFPPSQSKSAAEVRPGNELKISKYHLNGKRQRAWWRRYRARASWLNEAQETTNKFYRIGKIRIKHHKSVGQHQQGTAPRGRIKWAPNIWITTISRQSPTTINLILRWAGAAYRTRTPSEACSPRGARQAVENWWLSSKSCKSIRRTASNGLCQRPPQVPAAKSHQNSD